LPGDLCEAHAVEERDIRDQTKHIPRIRSPWAELYRVAMAAAIYLGPVVLSSLLEAYLKTHSKKERDVLAWLARQCGHPLLNRIEEGLASGEADLVQVQEVIEQLQRTDFDTSVTPSESEWRERHRTAVEESLSSENEYERLRAKDALALLH
jgi:hypothetical protein